MLDPIEAVRHRALASYQSLPRQLIRKEVYRLLVLKCRDLACKVRNLANNILGDLGIEHARSILTPEELTMTIRHLLRIASLDPDLDSTQRTRFVRELSKCTVKDCLSNERLL